MFLYKCQIPLPKSPGSVFFSSSEAIKLNLAGSSPTERGAEVRNNRLVLCGGFCIFFFGSISVFVKCYESFYEVFFPLDV